MDIQDYQYLSGELLKEKIRSLPRGTRDEQLRQFGAQYALLCQRLEAIYSPDRIDQFVRLRPGGLDEIDQAIEGVGPNNRKALALLKSFREINRVLLPFMDVYEEQVLEDLKYMDKDDLRSLYANISAQKTSAEAAQKKEPADYRQMQNAGGTLRLTTLMLDAIRRELKDRFGTELE
jgi:hypothetical protein